MQGSNFKGAYASTSSASAGFAKTASGVLGEPVKGMPLIGPIADANNSPKPQGETISVKRKLWNTGAKILVWGAGLTTALLLLLIIGYIAYRGIPCITWDLLSSQTSYREGTIGILPNILNTLYLIIVAMCIVLPLGVGAAVYLTEYASNRKLVAVIELATETLAGIPSIVFGLVGMLMFVQFLGLKQGILAGGLTLVMVTIPTIMRTTQEALRSVPEGYREGAQALGAGKWRTIRTVVLPSSINGILSGCILAIGRVIEESAALLFTAGFGLVLNDFVTSLTSSSATLTVALYVYASERGEIDVAFAIAFVLLCLAFLINFLAKFVGKKLAKN